MWGWLTQLVCVYTYMRLNKYKDYLLSTETVKSSAIALEGVNDIKHGHGLTLRVLRIGIRIADDLVQESTEDDTGMFVNKS